MVAVTGASWRAIDLPLLGFVLGLGLIVRALADHGLGDLVTDVLPQDAGLFALLGAALLAALLANLLNNVPALAAAAARGGGRRPGDRAGGADRRQLRAEPHLHRLAGDAAVAAASCTTAGTSRTMGSSTCSARSRCRRS